MTEEDTQRENLGIGLDKRQEEATNAFEEMDEMADKEVVARRRQRIVEKDTQFMLPEERVQILKYVICKALRDTGLIDVSEVPDSQLKNALFFSEGMASFEMTYREDFEWWVSEFGESDDG